MGGVLIGLDTQQPLHGLFLGLALGVLLVKLNALMELAAEG